MYKFLTLCLAAVTAMPLLSSCACPRCHGSGTEIAMSKGTHPYTKKKYRANEVIPCLKCGGQQHMFANPMSGSMAPVGKTADDLLAEPTGNSRPATIHVHEHYTNNNYVVW